MTDERETAQGFGQRTPSEPAPAVTPPDRHATKRSRTVSMGLVAGAGLAALGLGTLGRPEFDDVLVYSDAEACAAEAVRTADDCRSAYALARAAYPATAPHYENQPACESHHGLGHCLTDPAADASRRHVPRMAGYMLARSPDQTRYPEPVYEHAGGGGHHGYCTGSGTKVTRGSGASTSSGKVRSVASSSGTKFGGFGHGGHGFFGSGG